MPSVVCVIGSSNTDMVIKGDKLPAPGETVLGGTFLMNPGGKGANQAVAAARLATTSSPFSPGPATTVTFVANVGNDIFGRQALQQFEREGIRTDFVTTDADEPSGVALIGVDSKGENCIMVASGANARLGQEQVARALAAETNADNAVVLLQLETPIPTVDYAIRQSHERGMRVVLNPAPAQLLDPAVLACLHVITPNETEAELLTGVRVTDETTAQQAAHRLHEMGVPNVVITLGSRGAYLSTPAGASMIAAPPVTAVDTTAAGDCFNGALVIAIAEGLDLPDAVAFACKAASISVTRMGAQASIPHRHEVDSLPLLII
ncbi:ribokinase [Spirosoma utsteinense]|uniref:Ribokinase n=1 Tax=Spirosoma utsteinense TaxID=2585773 RepID=A0ABR6WF03_9BACT|nr:ribokinase [Spirosoma utsteinense]MBC3789209.1 ribokinase [Spirosoma utsteinense]MBC3795123.1 ribokinase [Spirosoma utsteinense]